MEFKQAMRVIKRICAARDDCEKCELELNCPFATVPSDHDYDKAEAILAKWAEEHPEKTIADDFYEKHPKAEKGEYGTPEVCAGKCGYVTACPPGARCSECWRRPLEEVER
jgi:hypothetical protein